MELFQPFLGHFLPLFQVPAAAKILFFSKTPLLKQKYFLKKRSIHHFSSWHIDLFLIYQALLSPLRNLLNHDLIRLAVVLHDVQTLLQTMGATTTRIVVFSIGITADGVEVINGSAAIVLSDAQFRS